MAKNKIRYPKVLRKSLQQGSTLVEAVIAIFVMSFGVLALMIAQIGSVNISINSANQSEVTRAVQNYVEVMRANAKISLKERVDTKGNSFVYVAKDYSKFSSSSCAQALNINLINSEIQSCTITADGVVKITWGNQQRVSDTSNNNDFSYTLEADQK